MLRCWRATGEPMWGKLFRNVIIFNDSFMPLKGCFDKLHHINVFVGNMAVLANSTLWNIQTDFRLFISKYVRVEWRQGVLVTQVIAPIWTRLDPGNWLLNSEQRQWSICPLGQKWVLKNWRTISSKCGVWQLLLLCCRKENSGLVKAFKVVCESLVGAR